MKARVREYLEWWFVSEMVFVVMPRMSAKVHRCGGDQVHFFSSLHAGVESLVSEFVFLLRQDTGTCSRRRFMKQLNSIRQLHVCDDACCPAALRCGARGAEAKPCGAVHIFARISVDDDDKRTSD